MRDLKLRDYQQQQLDFLKRNEENCCIQSPTGTGKSVVIEAYINYLREKGKQKIVVITPSQELVKNIKGYFGKDATMAFSGEIPNLFSPILVTTFQSAKKWIGLYEPEHFISDEAHLSIAQTWVNALIPGVRHDGFTATPNRLDGKGLNQNFSQLFLSPSIKWFIDNRYLAPFELTPCDYPEFTDMRTDNLKTQEEIFGSIPEIDKSVEIFMANSQYDKTLFFVTGVNHGKALEATLQHYGIDASFVDSKTPTKVRNKAFNDFKFGNKQVLININLFTTGVDVPECSSVYACRFTYSAALHFQIAGRGWRYLPGKVFKYFDLAGNCYYHGSPTMPYKWSLEGQKSVRGSNKESLYHRCTKCFNELCLKRSIKEPVSYDCPHCGQTNDLYPTTRLTDTGKELVEQTFELLKLPSTQRELVCHLISIERSSKISLEQKITDICQLNAPKKITKLSLRRLGLDDGTIEFFLGN